MRIYTRTGDGGETSLFDGSRVHKDDARIEAYGTIDELNAVIGALAGPRHTGPSARRLAQHPRSFVSHWRHVCRPQWAARGPAQGGCVRCGRPGALDRRDWSKTCRRCATLCSPAVRLRSLHAIVARTVCRRAERRAVALDRLVVQSADAMRYLNRLSDALFTLGRWAAHSEGTVEEKWPRDKNSGS